MMKLRPIFNLFRGAEKYLDRQEIGELCRSGSRRIKKTVLQKLSHLLLSGKIGLKAAHYVLPDDVSAAVVRLWGVTGNLKNVDLKQLARETRGPDILASLAENPEVSLTAAKNEHCPWQAAAQALCNMPPDNPSTYPLEEAYLESSIEHVREVIWSHPADMINILNYISAHNVDLYGCLRLFPIYCPRIEKE